MRGFFWVSAGVSRLSCVAVGGGTGAALTRKRATVRFRLEEQVSSSFFTRQDIRADYSLTVETHSKRLVVDLSRPTPDNSRKALI